MSEFKDQLVEAEEIQVEIERVRDNEITSPAENAILAICERLLKLIDELL